ncbi:class E sortase [Rarobacter faecitabidus]|uniref:class E sortase n=1 Tax=Rarobacter faecitabidus TaxID=13243 RepID=UPI001FEA1F20|nr:class E sortase [Rarobacter faecitabidus]
MSQIESELPSRASRRRERDRATRRRASIPARIAGVVGELLITAGIVVLGYVAWQVWWDSNAAVAVAQEHIQEFEREITPRVLESAELVTEGEPPTVERVAEGETFGVLIVPKWYEKTDNNMPIREGTTAAILDQAAAGHYTDSAMPGEVGNFALAGHRRTHGNSFRFINELEKGDQVIVETADTWFVYEVYDEQIVTPDQVDVVAPVPGDPGAEPTRRLLTLTTCHSLRLGEWGNDHRWIVHAELLGWMARANGTPDQVLETK